MTTIAEHKPWFASLSLSPSLSLSLSLSPVHSALSPRKGGLIAAGVSMQLIHLTFLASICIQLLMAEILHPLIGSLSRYLQGFMHPRWLFGISAINSSTDHMISPLSHHLQSSLTLTSISYLNSPESFNCGPCNSTSSQ